MLRPRLVLPLLVAALLGGCGSGGDDDPEVWTGRVTSKTERQYCLTPDRGTRFRCVFAEGARGEIEVGQCVEATFPEDPLEATIEAVDDAACAAGDLGG